MKDPREIWARTSVFVWPERYVLASLGLERLAEAAKVVASRRRGFCAVVVEHDEVSLTADDETFRSSGLETSARVARHYRAITLDCVVDLDTCGFLAPAARRLADAGVSVVPQCAFLRDHLLVPDKDLDRAVGVLEEWIRVCRDEAPTPSEPGLH